MSVIVRGAPNSHYINQNFLTTFFIRPLYLSADHTRISCYFAVIRYFLFRRKHWLIPYCHISEMNSEIHSKLIYDNFHLSTLCCQDTQIQTMCLGECSPLTKHLTEGVYPSQWGRTLPHAMMAWCTLCRTRKRCFKGPLSLPPTSSTRVALPAYQELVPPPLDPRGHPPHQHHL